MPDDVSENGLNRLFNQRLGSAVLCKNTVKYSIIFLLLSNFLTAGSRFPKPEFDTAYITPVEQFNNVRGSLLADALLLIAALLLSAWFIHKKKSRTGILATTVFSLIWFGFIRKGCVCSVGAIQNIMLGIINPSYKIPLAAMLFFTLPLFSALLFGRNFCAAVCPLGAIQEVVIIKPLKIPYRINWLLGFFPYLYLAFTVVFVYTGLGFLICRFEPFVAFFRLSGSFGMLVFGFMLLGTGAVIARPYCRFLCTYSIFLKITSLFGKLRYQITPYKCISCHLCADSCPVQAIKTPAHNINRKITVRAFLKICILIPAIILLSGISFKQLRGFIVKLHPKVQLAARLAEEEISGKKGSTIETEAYYNLSINKDALTDEIVLINSKAENSLFWAGLFFGLVICLRPLYLLYRPQQQIYEADPADCLACGRCMEYCPLDSENSKRLKDNRHE